jgi:hypothetical protein
MKLLVTALAAIAIAAPISVSAAPTAPAATASFAEAQPLADSIRQALVAAIKAGRDQGLTGNDLETYIGQRVEQLIIQSGADPLLVQRALRLAMAQEKCVFEGERWTRTGCTALAQVSSTVEAALSGGPAAAGGAGGIAQPLALPLPGGGGSSDYRAPLQ